MRLKHHTTKMPRKPRTGSTSACTKEVRYTDSGTLAGGGESRQGDLAKQNTVLVVRRKLTRGQPTLAETLSNID